LNCTVAKIYTRTGDNGFLVGHTTGEESAVEPKAGGDTKMVIAVQQGRLVVVGPTF